MILFILARYKGKLKLFLKELLVLILSIVGAYYGIIRFNNSAESLLIEQNTVKRRDNKITKLEAEKDGLEKEKLYLENTLKALIINFSELSHDFDDVKRPMWFKIYDKENDIFLMVRVNKAYVDEYLTITALEYLGNLDALAHGTELAKEYEKNDRRTLISNEPIQFIQNFNKKGRKGKARYWKWRIDKGRRIYIYGLEIEEINERET